MRFKGKVVLVTGASSGIGAAAALGFAKEGASLCITGRNEQRLEGIAQKCSESTSSKVVKVVADLSSSEGCERVFTVLLEEFNQLDVLVNNAGIALVSPFEQIAMDQYNRTFDINVKGLVNMGKLAIPYLKKTKGNIVNVSSCYSMKPFKGFTIYGMSKAAVDYFTKCTALELASSGVRVNSVNPGAVKTNVLKQSFENEDEIDKIYKELREKNLLIPISEITEAILYISSDLATSITGSCNLIDAGMNLTA